MSSHSGGLCLCWNGHGADEVNVCGGTSDGKRAGDTKETLGVFFGVWLVQGEVGRPGKCWSGVDTTGSTGDFVTRDGYLYRMDRSCKTDQQNISKYN